MQTKLSPHEMFSGFNLRSLRDYSYESLLELQISEEIILAILSDFNRKKPTEVIRQILSRLQSLGEEEIIL